VGNVYKKNVRNRRLKIKNCILRHHQPCLIFNWCKLLIFWEAESAEDLVGNMEPFAVVLSTTSRLLGHPFSFASCSWKKKKKHVQVQRVYFQQDLILGF